MKFKIDDSITNRNVEYAIKYLFDSDNISHQAIIIHQPVSYTHLRAHET